MGAADVWAAGAAYEPFIGRWSRLVAHEFLTWLAVAPGRRWLDVGCGTGELTRAIVRCAAPGEVIGIDPSEGFLAYARAKTAGAQFREADAQALPFEDESFDAVVSGLALNFVPDPALALREMRRVTRQRGTVAAYVWDYAEGMHMLRIFWDAADAGALDEARRFPLCRPAALQELFEALNWVELRAIEVPTVFRDFDDYWQPFLGGQGPAPTYVASLDEAGRTALRERLRTTLPRGEIRLLARAWAIRGVV
jgi:SAM-dependent methyltransferase